MRGNGHATLFLQQNKNPHEISLMRPQHRFACCFGFVVLFFCKGYLSLLRVVFGTNSSEFPSGTLAVAFFCILGELMLFAHLIQSTDPLEHPEANPVWSKAGQMCLPAVWWLLKPVLSQFSEGYAHPLRSLVLSVAVAAAEITLASAVEVKLQCIAAGMKRP